MYEKIIVGVYSIFLVCMCGLFLYLVLNVNPTRIIFPQDEEWLNGSLPPLPPELQVNTISNNTKVPDVKAVLRRTANNKTIRYIHKEYVQLVSPPLWPTMGPPKQTEATKAMSTCIKGRRSVQDDKNNSIINIDEKVFDSVLLKIIDDKGKSRIEIAFESTGDSMRKKIGSGRNKSNIHIFLYPNNNTKVDKSQFSKDTVIKLMPDNTLIVDDKDDSLIDSNGASNSIQKHKDDFITAIENKNSKLTTKFLETPTNATVSVTHTDNENFKLNDIKSQLVTLATTKTMEVYKSKVLNENESLVTTINTDDTRNVDNFTNINNLGDTVDEDNDDIEIKIIKKSRDVLNGDNFTKINNSKDTMNKYNNTKINNPKNIRNWDNSSKMNNLKDAMNENNYTEIKNVKDTRNGDNYIKINDPKNTTNEDNYTKTNKSKDELINGGNYTNINNPKDTNNNFTNNVNSNNIQEKTPYRTDFSNYSHSINSTKNLSSAHSESIDTKFNQQMFGNDLEDIRMGMNVLSDSSLFTLNGASENSNVTREGTIVDSLKTLGSNYSKNSSDTIVTKYPNTTVDLETDVLINEKYKNIRSYTTESLKYSNKLVDSTLETTTKNLNDSTNDLKNVETKSGTNTTSKRPANKINTSTPTIANSMNISITANKVTHSDATVNNIDDVETVQVDTKSKTNITNYKKDLKNLSKWT